MSLVTKTLSAVGAGLGKAKNFASTNANKAVSKVVQVADDVSTKGVKTAVTNNINTRKWKNYADNFVNEGFSGSMIDAAGGMVEFTDDALLKFSTKGKIAVGGLGAIALGTNTWNAIDQRDMGTTDGTVMRATPSIRRYLQNPQQAPGGADGSLVFALHNNRRGGYL